MKSVVALLFLAAVAACAWAELEYHPQAVLHYLEMEDREMAKKVRRIVKARGLPSGKPTFPPSFKPSGFPTGIPLKVVSIQCNDLSEYKQMSSSLEIFFTHIYFRQILSF